MQVLLVEDNTLLANAIMRTLKGEGFSVNHVDRGSRALTAIRSARPDIVVLDLGLPDLDGLEVLRSAREQGFSNPVLILTARDTTSDKVMGLDAGADDYLAKPFEIDELLARLRAMERRLSNVRNPFIVIGEVSIDTSSHEVSVNGETIVASRREYMLLKALMESANKIQTRDALDSKLYSWGEEVSSNAVEVHIHNLRKKLPAGFIQTVRGVGYVVRKQADAG
ncbi:MAG: response regulator transcription factor [Pseudomonadales bacterium]|nr:response regulator transcription factor [Pseudomonadales bacterium]MCP5358538.1 response regulator transcription factor [Pseudomonadales bacterium]